MAEDMKQPDQDVLLLKELDELNPFAKSDFQLLINWFTFFLGANLVAIGYVKE